MTDPRHAAKRGDPIEAVSGIWSAVLGAEVVSADVNFFDAGGHSLLVMVLQEHLEELAGRRIPIEDLYEHTTVRAQAAMLTAAVTSAPAAELGARDRRRLLARRGDGTDDAP